MDIEKYEEGLLTQCSSPVIAGVYQVECARLVAHIQVVHDT